MIYQLCIVLALSGFAYSQNWDVGTGSTYDTATTILLGENSRNHGHGVGDVGFKITAKLEVLPLWKDPSDPEIFLVSIKLIAPQLYIKSRKAPEPEGFIEHSSRLTDIPKDPILILLRRGQIIHTFAVPGESLTSLNLKRGLASAFQYKLYQGTVQERDASGLCNVTYTSLNPISWQKVKENCTRIKNVHYNSILGVNLYDSIVSKYELTEKLLLNIMIEDEKHEMSLAARPEAKSAVSVHRTIQLFPDGVFKQPPKVGTTYTEIINKLESRYESVSIEAQNEYVPCPETGCDTLEAVLESSFAALDSNVLGTAKSAAAFLKIVPLIRNSTAEPLAKILKSPKYHDILPQLYDLYGSASTPEAHQAAMKILRQDETGDNTERYLWALSMSPFPDATVIKDILKRSEETISNDKLSETLALTAAAMAKRSGTNSVIEKVKDSLELGLYSCSDEPCKIKFLRALGNLGSKSVIPILLKHTNSTRALSVIAWKSLATYNKKYITSDIKNLALKNFLQLTGQKLDSSVRTQALNVVLQNNPSVEELQILLKYLTRQDPVYEVKKFLLQRLQQLSDTDLKFQNKFQEALKREVTVSVNYNTFGLKGLSTAFTRNFLNSAGSNGTLVTIQEISSGLLKRGIVDIVLENGSDKYTFFSLGLFAGGLNSFISSNNPEEDVPAENEVATAGMELSFLDVNVRPFVFFSGQGELMGHVWSGTASEKTPAFQTAVNLHRHREIIPLASGFIVEIDVEGAVSFNLAGQIQLSLWSRNAQSLVEMGAGISIHGSSKVLTNFVQSRAEFTLNLEPKLELATDVDFSGTVSLCMRLAQPRLVIKHNIYKVERIPGSRHRLRKTRRTSFVSPARSYLLNSKNNEMCSNIFSD